MEIEELLTTAHCLKGHFAFCFLTRCTCLSCLASVCYIIGVKCRVTWYWLYMYMYMYMCTLSITARAWDVTTAKRNALHYKHIVHVYLFCVTIVTERILTIANTRMAFFVKKFPWVLFLVYTYLVVGRDSQSTPVCAVCMHKCGALCGDTVQCTVCCHACVRLW